jgi:hypothetical protein
MSWVHSISIYWGILKLCVLAIFHLGIAWIFKDTSWRAPKSLVRPKLGPSYSIAKMWRTRGMLPAFSTKRGRGACWSSGIRTKKSDKPYSLTWTCIKTNHKVVTSHSGAPLVLGRATGNTDSLDSPRPGLRGSHHLPPYSILCVTPPHLHPNGTFSRDSQSGVPKLSRFGLPGLWTFITSRSNLRLGRSLKQTCSSLWELSNGVSHSTCTH